MEKISLFWILSFPLAALRREAVYCDSSFLKEFLLSSGRLMPFSGTGQSGKKLLSY
jgi:hypothetical protein